MSCQRCIDNQLECNTVSCGSQDELQTVLDVTVETTALLLVDALRHIDRTTITGAGTARDIERYLDPFRERLGL